MVFWLLSVSASNSGGHEILKILTLMNQNFESHITMDIYCLLHL